MRVFGGLLVDGICCGIPYGTNVRMRIQESNDLNDDNASSFLFNLFAKVILSHS